MAFQTWNQQKPSNTNDVFDEKSNSNRPEAFAPRKPHDLQTCFRAAGLPHTVTVSPNLAAIAVG